jgi:hypothetical protein
MLYVQERNTESYCFSLSFLKKPQRLLLHYVSNAKLKEKFGFGLETECIVDLSLFNILLVKKFVLLIDLLNIFYQSLQYHQLMLPI